MRSIIDNTFSSSSDSWPHLLQPFLLICYFLKPITRFSIINRNITSQFLLYTKSWTKKKISLGSLIFIYLFKTLCRVRIVKLYCDWWLKILWLPVKNSKWQERVVKGEVKNLKRKKRYYRLLRLRIEKKTDEMNKNDFDYHTKERRNLVRQENFGKRLFTFSLPLMLLHIAT